MHRHPLPLAVAILALATAGCGSGDDSGKRAAEPTTATPAQAAPPGPKDIPQRTSRPKGPYNGRFTGTLTRAQATKMGDPSFAGKVMLTLRPNGRYAMSDRKGTANGLYSAAPGNRLVFARDDNCDPDLKGKGLYGWKIEGKVLRITALVAETGGCTGRSILLTLPTWTRG